ncbi:MAG: glycosyltransferase, partial [Caulobacteraceae bacterium]
SELIVRFSGPAGAGAVAPTGGAGAGGSPTREARSCDSCQQISCHRHEGSGPATTSARQVWLVDEAWPEFQALWARRAGPDDLLGLPLDGGRWRMPRYAWAGAPVGRTGDAVIAALGRSAAVRRMAAQGPARRRAELAGAGAIARSLERLLTQDDLEVVVAQSLLPYLWTRGRLGGRRFSVLMTRSPMGVLQARLDEAHAAAPEQLSLADFRADPALVAAEAQALAAAHRIMTPHAAVAAQFGQRAERLDWIAPRRGPAEAAKGRRIAFPGPTAARKGAWAVREAARALDLEVVLAGSALEGEGFWDGVSTLTPGRDWLDGVAAVVQPAVVEDNPRRLLGALAAGVPVIATPACGLDPQPGLTLIPPGDAAALIRALKRLMD